MALGDPPPARPSETTRVRFCDPAMPETLLGRTRQTDHGTAEVVCGRPGCNWRRSAPGHDVEGVKAIVGELGEHLDAHRASETQSDLGVDVLRAHLDSAPHPPRLNRQSAELGAFLDDYLAWWERGADLLDVLGRVDEATQRSRLNNGVADLGDPVDLGQHLIDSHGVDAAKPGGWPEQKRKVEHDIMHGRYHAHGVVVER